MRGTLLFVFNYYLVAVVVASAAAVVVVVIVFAVEIMITCIPFNNKSYFAYTL